MRTPIYWHRLIYRNTYGRSHPAFDQRFEKIVELIKPGSSVLDTCCGDARLYTHYLKTHGCDYQGIDLSLSMVPHQARSHTTMGNVIEMELPEVDYVVMMEALYHFGTNAPVILKRMRASAREKVIVLEQVKNKITFLPGWIARFLSNPGNGSGGFRFDRKRLEGIIDQVDAAASKELVFNGYDLLIVMSGAAGKRAPVNPTSSD
jgi:SAM-dependent methyltransferase